jgi:hypothetical protein
MCPHHGCRRLQPVQHHRRGCHADVHHRLAQPQRGGGGAVRGGAAERDERVAGSGRGRVSRVLRNILHLRLQHLQGGARATVRAARRACVSGVVVYAWRGVGAVATGGRERAKRAQQPVTAHATVQQARREGGCARTHNRGVRAVHVHRPRGQRRRGQQQRRGEGAQRGAAQRGRERCGDGRQGVTRSAACRCSAAAQRGACLRRRRGARRRGAHCAAAVAPCARRGAARRVRARALHRGTGGGHGHFLQRSKSERSGPADAARRTPGCSAARPTHATADSARGSLAAARRACRTTHTSDFVLSC